jgi:hypothetical protein
MERLARKAVRLSQAISVLAVLSGFAITALTSGISSSWQTLPAFLVAGALLFWMQRRASGRIRAVAASTEIELDDAAIHGRNSLGSTTIRREDVTELRYLRDGIVVRGRDLSHILQLKPELEGFDELVGELESWLPPGVARKRSSGSTSRWTVAITVASLGLMVAAYSTDNPSIGIPCCLLEALFLIGCVVWVWKSASVVPRLKWMMLIVVLPVLSLVARAYQLWRPA